jgi:A/G-specific adenine glycosylase
MLQQTTVATVIDYYHKFITKWHTIQVLANASLDDVMTEWAGLGYYSRARNLYKTAVMIVENYGGIFPSDETELIKLAGIGRYSAASISAIAFDKPAAVMDGNIERIISRLYCIETPLPKAKNDLYALSKTLTPQNRAGDYAQAMMDLGATVCTPKKPLCKQCPIHGYCLAYKNANPEYYPVKIPKPQKPNHKGAIFLIIDTHTKQIIVEKRPPSGLFGGMDIFPYCNPHETKETVKDEDFIALSMDKILGKYGIYNTSHKIIGQIKHIFTHFTFYADIILLEAEHTTLDTIMHALLAWIASIQLLCQP